MSRVTSAFWDATSRFGQTDSLAGAQSAAFAILKPEQWNQTLDDLRAMRGLTDDWDGNGAIAPVRELIESAIEWALRLAAKDVSPPGSVMAGPNGTILFNWQDENNFLDAELTRPNYVEWMQIVPGRPTQHGAELISVLEGQRNFTYENERMTYQGKTLAGTV